MESRLNISGISQGSRRKVEAQLVKHGFLSKDRMSQMRVSQKPFPSLAGMRAQIAPRL